MRHYTLVPVEIDGGHSYLHVLVNYPPKVSQQIVGGCPVVPDLLCGQLRWRSDQCHSPIHRATNLVNLLEAVSCFPGTLRSTGCKPPNTADEGRSLISFADDGGRRGELRRSARNDKRSSRSWCCCKRSSCNQFSVVRAEYRAGRRRGNQTCSRKQPEIRGTAENGGGRDILPVFTVPQLRALAPRAPFFSDGSAATLLDVVNFYDKRFSINLSAAEKKDLVNFLSSL
jgi:hypothetical protein